jgi:hypothetical protein
MKLVLFLLVLLSLVILSPNAKASCSLPFPSIPDCISAGVSAGIEKTMEKSGDDLVNAATNTTTNSSTSQASAFSPLNNFIVDMLDPSFNPEDIPWVIQTRDFTALVYIFLAVMYLTWGGAYHNLHNAVPGLGTEIDWALGTNYRDFHFSQYAANGIKALIFPMLGYFGLNYLLLISDAFTRLTISDALTTLIPGEMNPTVYLVLAVVIFLLSIFMTIRYIVITIFSAFLLVVLGAYLFDETRSIASMLLKYLVILIFMPFILAMIAAGGIAFIEGASALTISKPVEYIALGLVMLFAAAVMVFSWRLIAGVAKTTGMIATRRI